MLALTYFDQGKNGVREKLGEIRGWIYSNQLFILAIYSFCPEADQLDKHFTFGESAQGNCQPDCLIQYDFRLPDFLNLPDFACLICVKSSDSPKMWRSGNEPESYVSWFRRPTTLLSRRYLSVNQSEHSELMFGLALWPLRWPSQRFPSASSN